jgi:hypothetical protein
MRIVSTLAAPIPVYIHHVGLLISRRESSETPSPPADPCGRVFLLAAKTVAMQRVVCKRLADRGIAGIARELAKDEISLVVQRS